MDEPELLVRAKAGDGVAFGVLYDRHRARLYGVALKLTDDPSDSEDIVNETFYLALRNLRLQHGNFAAWLTRICHNKAIDFIRRKKREGWHPTEELVDHGSVEGQVTGKADRSNDRRLIRKLMVALDDTESEILELFLSNDLAGRDRAGRIALIEELLKKHGREALAQRFHRTTPGSFETTFRSAVRKMRTFATSLGVGEEVAP